MTCSCCRQLSPFHYADFPRDSIFIAAPKQFTVGASQGKTASQIASETVQKVTQKTGRSPGSIPGISAKGDLLIEESNHRRWFA
jgi:hypothetical protein